MTGRGILRLVPTVLFAWTTVVAACVAATVFGRSARSAGATGLVPLSTRIGLLLSVLGPGLTLMAGLAAAAVTGAWLGLAVVVLAALVAVAVVGLLLAPL